MIKIGIFTDLQYADRDNEGERHYRDSIPKFLEAAGYFEAQRPDFLLHLGDAINNDWVNLTRVRELFSLPEIPLYCVAGNHDYLVGPEHRGMVHAALGLPESGYLSFTRIDPETERVWRFVLLNGNEISLYAARDDREKKEAEKVREKFRLPNGSLPQGWNGAMTAKQLDWLDRLLAASDREGEAVVVCNHFPLYGGSRSLNAAGLSFVPNLPVFFHQLGVSQWNGDDLLAILDRHRSVRAYWAGHLHEGAFGVRNGIPHFTFSGMVQTHPNAFAFLTIRGDVMEAKGFGDQPELKFDPAA